MSRASWSPYSIEHGMLAGDKGDCHCGTWSGCPFECIVAPDSGCAKSFAN